MNFNKLKVLLQVCVGMGAAPQAPLGAQRGFWGGGSKGEASAGCGACLASILHIHPFLTGSSP